MSILEEMIFKKVHLMAGSKNLKVLITTLKILLNLSDEINKYY